MRIVPLKVKLRSFDAALERQCSSQRIGFSAASSAADVVSTVWRMAQDEWRDSSSIAYQPMQSDDVDQILAQSDPGQTNKLLAIIDLSATCADRLNGDVTQ